MKHNILLLCTLCTIFASCTTPSSTEHAPEPAVRTVSGSSVENTSARSLPTETETSIAEADTQIEFPSPCPYYRCGSYSIYNKKSNQTIQRDGPKGYDILPVSILPKGYLLTQGADGLHTFHTESLQLRPFIVDNTKKQLVLKEHEALFARESFDEAGNFILIVFSYEVQEDECQECHRTNNTRFVRAYTYDQNKDILNTLSISKPQFIFESNDFGTLSHSALLYSSRLGQLTSWQYLNYDVYRGPIGEPDVQTGPIYSYDLQKQQIQEILPAKDHTISYVAPAAGGKLIHFHLGEVNSTLAAPNKLMTMRALTITDMSQRTHPTTTLTLSPQAQKELRKYEDLNMSDNPAADFDYGCIHAEITKNKVILHGLHSKILLTREGDTITGGELYKSNE